MTRTITRREVIAWALAVVLAVSVVVVSRSDHAGAGAAGPSTEVVYIATGANFPDALGAAATAALGLGPVLLVQQNEIPSATMNELSRLQPPMIIITGGTAVVSAAVEAQLEALHWNPDVTRIGGANRFETAAQLSASVFPTTGMYPRAAYGRFGPSLGAGTGVFQTVTSATIEAPAPGILIMNAGIRLSRTTGTGIGNCRLRMNGTEVSVRGFQHSVSDNNNREGCPIERGITVDAGTYTITYEVDAPNAGTVWTQADLTVLWVPFDGMGAIPTP